MRGKTEANRTKKNHNLAVVVQSRTAIGTDAYWFAADRTSSMPQTDRPDPAWPGREVPPLLAEQLQYALRTLVRLCEHRCASLSEDLVACVARHSFCHVCIADAAF